MLTGALFACDRKLDIIGTVVLGLVTGYGGGIIRDMLLQTHGVYFTSHPDLILICIAICAFVFYFRGIFKHLEATVFLADALSVGLFALAGASKRWLRARHGAFGHHGRHHRCRWRRYPRHLRR